MTAYTQEKQSVLEICQILLKQGYLKTTEGNVSVRVNREDSLLSPPPATIMRLWKWMISVCLILT